MSTRTTITTSTSRERKIERASQASRISVARAIKASSGSSVLRSTVGSSIGSLKSSMTALRGLRVSRETISASTAACPDRDFR